MHLPTHPLFAPLLPLLTILTLAVANKPPSNPPTTPYIVNYLAKWELQSLSNKTLAVSSATASTKSTSKYLSSSPSTISLPNNTIQAKEISKHNPPPLRRPRHLHNPLHPTQRKPNHTRRGQTSYSGDL